METAERLRHRGSGLGVLLGGNEMRKDAYATPEAKKLLPAVPFQQVSVNTPKGKKGDPRPAGVPLNWDDPEIFKHPLLHLIGE